MIRISQLGLTVKIAVDNSIELSPRRQLKKLQTMFLNSACLLRKGKSDVTQLLCFIQIENTKGLYCNHMVLE